MGCKRCGGLSIGVSFSGGVIATEAWGYDGWKCLNCGHVTDPVILKNKEAQLKRANRPRYAKPMKARTLSGADLAA